MFVITEIEDTVEIRASSKDKNAAVARQLELKYCNHLSEEFGIGMHLYTVVEIKDYVVRGAILLSTVVFQILFYRFYQDEVCTGVILCQDENGIIIGNNLFKRYVVQHDDLFENCEYVADSDQGRWTWNYKKARLTFYNGDKVRFKIKKVQIETASVLVCINEQGLGSELWWD
ncbi:DNA-directed RNA polymerase III subunit RPC8 [Pancytospora epiphaga]|nr:DNA-directed RNA polymerase III subunit RPC8 [Pancytospora epiphaga]